MLVSFPVLWWKESGALLTTAVPDTVWCRQHPPSYLVLQTSFTDINRQRPMFYTQHSWTSIAIVNCSSYNSHRHQQASWNVLRTTVTDINRHRDMLFVQQSPTSTGILCDRFVVQQSATPTGIVTCSLYSIHGHQQAFFVTGCRTAVCDTNRHRDMLFVQHSRTATSIVTCSSFTHSLDMFYKQHK